MTEIEKKLDILIALYKIGLNKELRMLSEEVKNDKTSLKILELADGSLTYGDLVTKIAKIIGVSEKTVKRRISELAEKGLLTSNREGSKVFYTNSGIIEV